MAFEQLLTRLSILANESLALWDVPQGATASLINVSENTTYLIEAPGNFKAILRIHRENYHSRRAIECELAWLHALGLESSVTTPDTFNGRNGEVIQQAQINGLPDVRYLVLFEFVKGDPPDEAGDLTDGFRGLGAIAARCHDHVSRWKKPANFERLIWDVDAVFGPFPTWGDWRDAPEVSKAVREVLEKVEATIRKRLNKYGKTSKRYNLIHADMRLANLLVDDNGTRLIDFDDCGLGWFMYDFAAAISFIEDDPRIPSVRAAWIEGYRSIRKLHAEDENEIDTFVMLRRMALLAWIGSHIEAPEPRKYAPGFADTTARLGEAYLAKYAPSRIL